MPSKSDPNFDNSVTTTTRTQGTDTINSPTNWDVDNPRPISQPDSTVNTPQPNPVPETPTAPVDAAPSTPTPDAPAAPDPTTGGVSPDGLQWFSTNFKTIAIVATATALIAGIAALISKLSKSIKVRYNKCVKTLQRAQKDFTLDPNGLNMKAVLPGVGSRFNDFLSRLFTWNFKTGKGKNNLSNIGLHPFCNRYKDEIDTDYRQAKEAYSKIRATVDINGEINSSDEVVYKSFKEAYGMGNLNESVLLSILGSVAASALLSGIRAGAGVFRAPKIDDKGNIVPGGDVAVQVTKESTREICYAIINNFADKYINMTAVYKALGIDTNSLSDLNASDCDKLAKILSKYTKPEANTYTKQYARVKKAYDNMLNHYYRIGDGIIQNFSKFTQADDEKHANLLVASKEKLQNMWDTQKDIYNNNFSHVIIEIVSYPGYINYLNFILNSVIPVFKTGLAGDADYVLDVDPKTDEYYVVKQTGNNDALGGSDEFAGKSVLARIVSFDKESQKLTIELCGLIKSDYTINDEGVCELGYDPDIDFKAYDDNGKKRQVTLSYSKWFSLDPTYTDWQMNERSDLFYRGKKVSGKNVDQYIYAYKRADSEVDGYDKVVFVSRNSQYGDIIGATTIKLGSPIEPDKFEKFCVDAGDGSDNVGFYSVGNPVDCGRLAALLEHCKNKNQIDLNGTDELREFINNNNPGIEEPAATSSLYRKDDGEHDVYIYAGTDSDLSSVRQPDSAMRLNEDDDNDDNELDPNGNNANKKNITKCIIGSMKNGANILVDSADSVGFNGSFIRIKPECSIKEFDTAVKNLGFEVYKDDAKSIKKKIADLILGQKGNVKVVQLSNDFDINNIEKAVKEVVERMDCFDKIISDAGKMAADIKSKIENDFKNYDFKEFYFQGGDQAKLTGGKKLLMGFVTDKQNPGFRYDTGAKDDDTNNRINLLVYPIKYRDTKANADKIELMIGLPITKKGINYMYTATLDDDSIKAAIEAVAKMAKAGAPVDYSKLNMPKLHYIIDFMTCYGNQLDSLIKFSNDGNVDIANNKTESTDVDGVKYDVKTIQNKNDSLSYQIVFSTGGATKFAVIIKRAQTSAQKPVVSSVGGNDAEPFGDMKELKRLIKKFYENYQNGSSKNNSQNNNNQNNNTQNNQNNNSQNNQNNNNHNNNQGQPQGDQNQQNGNDQPKPATPDNQSVKYTYANDMSESVTVTRTLDTYKNWYILSESTIKDYKSDGVSKLDEDLFVKRLATKSDCQKFAKQRVNARFEKATRSNTYSVNASNDVSLFESAVLVKFDENENIIQKINLGKNKIF